MKNKKIVLILIIVLFILLCIILKSNKKAYTIEVELIDAFSPDRKLIVYNNQKEIDFEEIQYNDGTYLCSGTNPTVSYGELEGEEELIVKINDKKQVTAKIVEK